MRFRGFAELIQAIPWLFLRTGWRALKEIPLMWENCFAGVLLRFVEYGQAFNLSAGKGPQVVTSAAADSWTTDFMPPLGGPKPSTQMDDRYRPVFRSKSPRGPALLRGASFHRAIAVGGSSEVRTTINEMQRIFRPSATRQLRHALPPIKHVSYARQSSNLAVDGIAAPRTNINKQQSGEITEGCIVKIYA